MGLNSTFTKGASPLQHRAGLNSTFQKSPHNNATFDLGSAANATFEVINRDSPAGKVIVKDSRSSSQDIDLEDRLSSTSESSMSHRLNDLGDVQHLARMQEESKNFN